MTIPQTLVKSLGGLLAVAAVSTSAGCKDSKATAPPVPPPR